MSKTHMSPNPIRTEADYRAALKRAEAFFDAAEEPDPDSEEGAYFEALLTRIEAHERKHYPVLPPDPVEAIRFRMEQAGLTVKDLGQGLGIPADVLIAQPTPRYGSKGR